MRTRDIITTFDGRFNQKGRRNRMNEISKTRSTLLLSNESEVSVMYHFKTRISPDLKPSSNTHTQNKQQIE
jgi:hypothetical protein